MKRAGIAREFVAALAALRNRTVPPTASFDRPNPESDLDRAPPPTRRLDRLVALMSIALDCGSGDAALLATRHAP